MKLLPLIKKSIVILSLAPLFSVATLYAVPTVSSPPSSVSTNPPNSTIIHIERDHNPGGDINRGLQDRTDFDRRVDSENRVDVRVNGPVNPTQPTQTQFPGGQTTPTSVPK